MSSQTDSRLKLIFFLSPPHLLQPEPKQSAKLVTALSSHIGTGSQSSKIKKKGNNNSSGADDAAVGGEFANVLEGEYLDFVLFEIEKVGTGAGGPGGQD